jgi:CRISPR-associated protein Csb2
MTLVLEIEYLLGVGFAARSPASEVPDWPPEPDRVFSALVASWGARGEPIGERDALEWLEAQASPEIAASAGFPRTVATVFVPPNDPETARVGDPAVMPSFRRRQPRRFPAYRPDDPTVRLVWRDAAVDAATLAALNALAADTAYIGHSSSPVRCRFRVKTDVPSGHSPRRRIYPGRLAELERAYHGGRRPSPGDAIRAISASQAPTGTSIFSDRWLILEHVGGEMPDLRAAGLVARALHKTVMAGYEQVGLGEAIPAMVSGHAPDGAPLRQPHLGFAPMAFVGFPHADGAVFGFALIPPRDGDLMRDPSFERALRAIMPWNDENGRRELRLNGNGLSLIFALAGDAPRRSLDPAAYIAAATTWATCTPIVLDRHLKEATGEGRQAEIKNLLRRACANIELLEPDKIVAGKHPAVEGAPSAYPSGRAPRWTGWRLPPSLGNRQLTHAVLRFREPVRGPVILGAGRFVGLGLCRALDASEEGR